MKDADIITARYTEGVIPTAKRRQKFTKKKMEEKGRHLRRELKPLMLSACLALLLASSQAYAFLSPGPILLSKLRPTAARSRTVAQLAQGEKVTHDALPIAARERLALDAEV